MCSAGVCEVQIRLYFANSLHTKLAIGNMNQNNIDKKNINFLLLDNLKKQMELDGM